MEPAVRKLIVQRFRSIPRETVSFDNPTYLVGRNGAGKTNLVDAFAFLQEAVSSPLEAVLDRRGGLAAVRNRTPGKGFPRHLGLGVVLGPIHEDVAGARYAFELRAAGGISVVREQCQVYTPSGARYGFNRTP